MSRNPKALLSSELTSNLNYAIRETVSKHLVNLLARMSGNSGTLKSLEASATDLAEDDKSEAAEVLRKQYVELQESYTDWREELHNTLDAEVLIISTLNKLTRTFSGGDTPRKVLRMLAAGADFDQARKAKLEQMMETTKLYRAEQEPVLPQDTMPEPTTTAMPVHPLSEATTVVEQQRELEEVKPEVQMAWAAVSAARADNGRSLRLINVDKKYVAGGHELFSIYTHDSLKHGPKKVANATGMTVECSVIMPHAEGQAMLRVVLHGHQPTIGNHKELEIVFYRLPTKRMRLATGVHEILVSLTNEELFEVLAVKQGEDVDAIVTVTVEAPKPYAVAAADRYGLTGADRERFVAWLSDDAYDPRFLPEHKGANWADLSTVTTLQRAMLCESINRTLNGNLSERDESKRVDVLTVSRLRGGTGLAGVAHSFPPSRAIPMDKDVHDLMQQAKMHKKSAD